MYSYPQIETVSLQGRRFYAVDPEHYYPSITTVLGSSQPDEKRASLEAWKARVGNKEAAKISADAATRGTNVHLMLERHLQGLDPKIEEFPETHSAIFRSMRVELRKINTVYGQEVALYSHDLMVAGRCDLIAEYQNELAIVDYKTSTRVKSEADISDYWLQCAFYALAHNEMFKTDISKMVIIMGVENKLPMVFKKRIDEELLSGLLDRIEAFYKVLT